MSDIAPDRVLDDGTASRREPLLASVADVDPHHGRQLVCHGYTVLLSDADGTITADRAQGLFDHDTRLLSSYEIVLAGVSPRVDSSGLLEPFRWTARLTVPLAGGDAKGPRLPQDALELTIRRRVGNGMIEELEIRNHSAVATTTAMTIKLDADFCDVSEIASASPMRGDTTCTWQEGPGTLTIDYHGSHNTHTLHRGVRVRVLRADSTPQGSHGALTFELRLPPHGVWHAVLAYEALIDDEWLSPVDSRSVLVAREQIAADWQRDRAHIESDPPSFGVAVERGADDLMALRNWEQDAGPRAWIPHAGVPTYTGVFGRDTLTAGWQAALVGPEILRGAIARLAATQATVDSAWHDAEPGKMIHEMRRGPLSELDIIPQRGYYGTQTSSSFFVTTLSELWHWTGDTGSLQAYLDTALRTFEWADRYGDADKDGFLEYTTRSTRGLKNQAWKDSEEAIRYPDGTLVENPIATVEEQAYHWLALQRMAEILLALGDDERSGRFLDRARRLRAAWHHAFWMEHEGFYAMALDPSKRPVRSIGSNPGHALAAGLVPVERAQQVADRLMAADLFSGWGIRTLSSAHPSYNPLAYHLGTVWPVENATFALGFKRYGLDSHVERLVTAMFEAADRFRHHRLPEALGGHSREEAPIPTVYPMSNSPQAWSASATIQMAQAMLGIYPFAPAHVLALVRPALPPWLRTVIVRNIRVGEGRVSLRFERDGDGATTYEVLQKTGPLHVVQIAPPQQADGSRQNWREALVAWMVEHAPGRIAAALRIALGDDT